MSAYQIREGKPCLGYLGDSPGDTDYQCMARYLRQRWRRDKIGRDGGDF